MTLLHGMSEETSSVHEAMVCAYLPSRLTQSTSQVCPLWPIAALCESMQGEQRSKQTSQTNMSRSADLPWYCLCRMRLPVRLLSYHGNYQPHLLRGGDNFCSSQNDSWFSQHQSNKKPASLFFSFLPSLSATPIHTMKIIKLVRMCTKREAEWQMKLYGPSPDPDPDPVSELRGCLHTSAKCTYLCGSKRQREVFAARKMEASGDSVAFTATVGTKGGCRGSTWVHLSGVTLLRERAGSKFPVRRKLAKSHMADARRREKKISFVLVMSLR